MLPRLDLSSAPGAARRPPDPALPQRAGEADRRLFLLCYALLLPLYLLPLLVTRFLPGLDLPFHLAIADMLRKGDILPSPYAAYEGRLGLTPYAVYYALLWLLSHALPLGAAHKLIMAGYVAALPLAMTRLLGACGRSRVPALLGFPLAYNLTVHYGFISFALSLPLLLLLLAEAALALTPARNDPASPRSGGRPLLRLGLLSLLLVLCHLQSYLLAVGCALTFVLIVDARLRRRLQAGAALVPSLLVAVLWQFGRPAHGDLGYALGVLWNRRRLNAQHGILPDLLARVRTFPQHLLKGFADGRDEWAALALLAVLGAYLVIGAVLARRSPASAGDLHGPVGRLRLAGALAWLLAVALYFAMPHHLQEFELLTFYPRFSVAVAALLPLLVPAGLLACPARLRPLLAAPALMVGLWWGVELVSRYRAFAEETADFAAVIDRTPPGGRALGLVFERASEVLSIESLLVGLPSYYPVERRAPGSMVPLTYCGLRHMPCRPRDPALAPPDPGAWTPRYLDPAKAMAYFDYFLVRGGQPPVLLFGRHAQALQVVAQAGRWVVYRNTTRPAAAPGTRP